MRKEEISMTFFFLSRRRDPSHGSYALAYFPFFLFFFITIYTTPAREAVREKNARRLFDRGEHLNLKGPKFEVLSSPKKFVVPSPGLGIECICMRKVFYNSFDYTLATMASKIARILGNFFTRSPKR